MPSDYRLLRGAALAFVLALAPAAVAAKKIELSPQAMRVLGDKALAAGYAKDAVGIADALLKRDPNDIGALLLRARALRALARFPEAAQSVRRAWRLADTAPEKFASAMVRAQVLSSQGRRTAAQFWLRRAVQAAPDPRAKAMAVRDFRYVRDRNPWVLNFSFSITPSNNVNNGSSSTTTQILGLPFVLSADAQALSGTIAQAGLGATYRLHPTETSRTEFRLAAMANNVWLSPSAKAAAPTARGSDYNFAAVEAGVWQEFRRSRASLAIWHWSATLGHNWYGGPSLSDYARLGLGGARPLSARVKASWDLSYEHQWRRDVASRSADVVSGQAGLTWQLRNHDILGVTVGARHTGSLAQDIDHQSVFARIAWSRAKPIKGVAIGASLSVERRNYGDFSPLTGPRRDTTVSADLTMIFTQVSYLGFSPSLDLTYARTDSTLGLYRSRQAGLLLGFRSQF